MINPLSIATRGRISKTVKKTLTLATIGWIVIATNPNSGTGVSYIAQGGSGSSSSSTETKVTKRKSFVLKDDEEILSIIKIFLECQK